MKRSKHFGFSLWTAAAVLAVVVLVPASNVMAIKSMHVDGSGRETPWGATSCAMCHDLTGTDVLPNPPSCTNCHNDFSEPNPPPVGHNLHAGHTSFGIDDRLDPMTNCSLCHGADLTGGIGRSCFTCHDQMWPGGGGNSPPDIDPGGPYQAAPGETVVLDASGTTDPDNDELSFLWLFGDGTPPELPSPNPVKSHVYADEGTYTALLTVLDGHNVVDPVPVEVVITASGGGNAAPTADHGGPYTGAAGQAVQFDGSASSDTDGTIASYDWDFGDGGSATGANPTHTYASDGSFTVTLTVTDDDGATDTATTSATISAVANEAPFADHGGPYTGTVGQSISLDGSASFDADGTIVSYAWDFGDSNVGSGAQPTHSYASAGTFTVTLTVTDDDGATDEVTTTATITEPSSNNPPVADPNGPYTGVVGQPVQFDGSGSYDTDGTIFAYLWNFGDGGVGTGATPTHTYAAAGTYTVELGVGDDGGGIDSATTTVEITESPSPGPGPAPSLGGDAWTVKVPLEDGEFQLSLRSFAGFLLVEEVFPDGMVLSGIGMENHGTVLWMDSAGAIFFGGIDRRAGTMHGLVFDYFGRDSIFLAEQQQPLWDFGGSSGGLFGMGLFGFGMVGGYTPTPTPPYSSCGQTPMRQPPRTPQPSCGTSSTNMGPRSGSGFGPRAPRGTMRYGSRRPGGSYRRAPTGMHGGF